MSTTIINILLCFLLVVRSTHGAEKDRLFLERGGVQRDPLEYSNNAEGRAHFEPPSEIDHGSNSGNERTIVQGRTRPTDCNQGVGTSVHHHAPCDDNVVSLGISARDDVTEAPTEKITDSDSSSEPCVSSDGTFGNIADDAALITVPITYLYEMEIVSGTNQSVIDNEVLPSLEKVVVDSILHDIFPDTCASTAIGKRKQRRKLLRNQRNRRLEAVGVSMYPPDYVTVNCKLPFSLAFCHNFIS